MFQRCKMFNKSLTNILFSFLCSILFIFPSFGESIEQILYYSYDEESTALLSSVESMFRIPQHLLMAVAFVESKWHPWAVNAQGRASYFDTKEEAVRFVQKLQRNNVKNIGVGYMQINLSIHGRRFKSLADAFDPEKNIAFGAKLIQSHYKKFDSWEAAVRYYHTANKKYNVPYRNRVYKVWGKIKETIES
jgi:soluble lytic murein transglycosylase-like protein